MAAATIAQSAPWRLFGQSGLVPGRGFRAERVIGARSAAAFAYGAALSGKSGLNEGGASGVKAVRVLPDEMRIGRLPLCKLMRCCRRA